MDGCGIWSPFQSGGIGEGAASRGSELQQEQDLPISSLVEEQLQLEQIYLLMDMEEHGHAEAPSSLSSTFPAASFSASPDEASSLVPGSSNLDTIPNLEELITCQEARQEQARRRNGHARGAFMPYSRHLSTKKKPKPGAGAGGQRAIKAAMSALARMHKVRLAQWQRYQMEMALAAVAPPTGSICGNQLQHVLSERKRREKLNDSFKALKTVLPPAPKKDKASILIRARDYVNTLKSRLSELEERNRTLVELQHQCDDGGERDDVSDEQIEVDINRAAAGAAEETSQEFHLKIVVRSGCNAMDAVVGILECLKELGDVRLADMDTGSRGTTLALQMKTSRCDDIFLKESVIKSVKGVMQSKIDSLSFFDPSVEMGI
ncbi:putative transcription factor bHLH041 isoform X2 [Panicum hallii]|uniref:putative transcription factor bHLH041 isoform X2 n=1 Tax=Panicum hallii TaxID=206008 RepID=UPI000DF4CCDB|nr:putative transcription factor bHLH041 isoform X2 [Panicum hallii]